MRTLNRNSNNSEFSKLKSKILRPALTSHFLCQFEAPGGCHSFIVGNYTPGLNKEDHLSIPCLEASLPGSSLATHELNDNFTGVTQKHAYRSLYDDRADFTFYVDSNYTQIKYFEGWRRYIIGEQQAYVDTWYPFRIKYPKDYKGTVSIRKFERDSKNYNGGIIYTLINAFPISITSMPISYDSSQLLKCTVSFSYDRYIQGKGSSSPTPNSGASSSQSQSGGTVQGQTTAAGVPSSDGFVNIPGGLTGSPTRSDGFYNIPKPTATQGGAVQGDPSVQSALESIGRYTDPPISSDPYADGPLF